ncbi:unnamed protein product [Orchesella dallaii]|uniref:VWFA domain-containing protein n=1 Tax=Orchesella dallaii TaxID=48710 RepID=A0ABP1PUP4_9HEXA
MDSIPPRLFSSESEQKRLMLMSQPELSSSTFNLIVNNIFRRSSKYSSLSYSRQRRRLVVTTGSRSSRSSGGSVSRHSSHSADKLNYCIRNTETMRLSTTESLPPPLPVILSNCPSDLSGALAKTHDENENATTTSYEKDGDLMGTMRKRDRGSQLTFPSSSSPSKPSCSSSSSRAATRSFHQTIMFTFLSVMLLCSAGHGVEGLRINQFGGYEDVVVNIGNDVPPITCEQLVMGIQMAFKSASAYLNEATKGKAYFHRVQIILPASWSSNGCGKVLTDSYTSASTVKESHFHIDGGHPIFGQRPWTKQFQGCGKQGDKIHLGYQYIVGYNGTNRAQEHEYPERMFVHEWAKFRYGVFEEIGFENDPIYPTSYYGDDNSGYYGYSRNPTSSNAERRPTSCTNKQLQGSWTGDCDRRSGSSKQQQQTEQQHQYHHGYEHPSASGESNDRSGANCVFEPLLSDNRNITSSIMSHPHLRNVRSFCDHSTHNRYAPTKHNFLCDRKSISEVIYSHPDFHNISSLARHGRNITPEFYVKQLTKPRFVLMVEESGNMNLRDVWKFLKLAIRKFIKYDLAAGTEIGIMTVSSSDIRIMANVTTLTDSGRGNIAEKLPNYPSIDTGSLSLRKGISTAINMLKWNGGRVAGSVIILISQGSISSMDMETVVHLLRQEQVSVATIEYPSIGDGKISSLSRATRSPHYMIRETGVGPQSHISTYIQLVNSLMDIQRFFTRGIALKWPTLVHQQEFKGDAPCLVNGTFSISTSQAPSEFYVYIANPIDPKVNRVEVTSPTGVKYSDQLSLLHDINVIKIDAIIDQPGIWRYSMERLGDSHQSHFVQVVTTTTSASSSSDEFSVRVFSNAGESRVVNLTQSPLILYTEVKRGISPVIDADVEASITAGTTKWSLKLLDNGNGDSDITKGDGIYSSYVVPPMTMQSALLEIIIKVETSPYRTKYVGMDSLNGIASASTSSPTYSSHGRRKDEPCCGSRMIPDWMRLKPMSYNERVMDAYTVKISNAKSSNYYAPSRIGDLRIVKQYDLELTLSFTAPGEDFDQGSVRGYQVFYRRSLDSKPMPREPYEADGSPAGLEVNLTTTLPDRGLFYIYVIAIDHHKNQGKPSNTLQVLAEPPPPEPNSGRTQKQTDMESREGEDNGKLRPWQIALIVGGVVAFVVVAAVVFLVCFFCRRRGTGGLGSTETKISTITNNKEPIHWSASQLLNEHEKRQSIYGHSSNGTSQQGSFDPETQNGSVGEQHQNQNQQQHPHHHHHQFNGSPGSSTRSFRSISENARKTSVDYESCSSDPTMRSMKGPTDYETPIESDPENYRTIDSYTRVHYRINGGPPPTYAPRMNGNAVQYPPQYHQNIPVNSYGTQLQYSGNIQGSLSSVASKQRNITMV